jgi:hypothetical protein
MVSENVLGKKIILMASELGFRLFRQNTGQGYVGESIRFSKPMKIEVMPGDVLIRKARPLHAGLCVGSSDVIGWSKEGKFCAIELKSSNGKPSEEQINFIDAVNKAGGIAGIVRDEETAFELLS